MPVFLVMHECMRAGGRQLGRNKQKAFMFLRRSRRLSDIDSRRARDDEGLSCSPAAPESALCIILTRRWLLRACGGSVPSACGSARCCVKTQDGLISRRR